MLSTRFHLLIPDLVIGLARAIDAAIEAASIQNARVALIEGRRSRVLRMVLEDDEDARPDPAPETRPISVVQ